MAQIQFGDEKENVVTRGEWPLKKAKAALKGETIAILGYGVQGPGQALNLRDNGFKVIVGQRKGTKTWDKAVEDGWVPGKTLFEIGEAAKRGTIIQYLLSDAGQIALWPTIKPHLTKGKCLYFSHGFAVTFKEDTGVIPPKDIDVVLVAPKGSGTSLRRLFLQGKGLNSSYAIFQDATGRAKERVISLGIGVGSGYLFETDFRKEVLSDLTGERGVLMGAIAGIFEAQFKCLRKHGHSPSEAFNETVEELTQSLMPLVAENGMDWMYANCSTTAQRGALDWRHKFREAVAPVYEELYKSVESGNEARIVITTCSRADYRERLEKELAALGNEEIWRAGKAVRALRPGASSKPAPAKKKASKKRKAAAAAKRAAPAKRKAAKRAAPAKRKATTRAASGKKRGSRR
jgi:ketol-acid reductoisomerase